MPGDPIAESLGAKIYGASPWIVIAFLAAVAGWETFRPGVSLKIPLKRRWSAHFLLFLTVASLRRLMPGLGTLAIAAAVRSSPYGLLNREAAPYAAQIIFTFAGLDLMDYWRHRMYHAVPWLWRIHLLHHSDRDFDFTNALRFHPFEITASDCVRWLTIAVLAPPPVAVAVSEVCGGLSALFTHANVRLPARAERILRWAVFTPGLHRIHHSQEEARQQHNLGRIFVWWDRLFGTFEAADFNPAFEVGVREVSQAESTRVSHIIGAPFRRYSDVTKPADADARPSSVPAISA